MGKKQDAKKAAVKGKQAAEEGQSVVGKAVDVVSETTERGKAALGGLVSRGKGESQAALERAKAAGYAATALPSGGSNSGAVAAALAQLGTPYVWGGAAPGGFDCSGLASWAFAQIGKSVPHYTGAIWSAFPHVANGALEPGDMLFFNGGDHMGIYIGNGQFVHAPHTGDVVRIATLADRGDYIGAVRA